MDHPEKHSLLGYGLPGYFRLFPGRETCDSVRRQTEVISILLWPFYVEFNGGDFADVKIPAGSIWHNHCCSSGESSPHTTGIFNSTSISKHPNDHEGSFVIHQGICHQVFFLHKRSGDALTRAGTVFRKPAKNALSDGYRLFKLLCFCPFSTLR